MAIAYETKPLAKRSYSMDANLETPQKTSWVDKLPYPKSAREYWKYQLLTLATLTLFSVSAVIRLFTKSGYC